MTHPDTSSRSNQKHRTRQALLRAAARLLKQGRKPTLEEVAEEALVSRATAYRYFANVDALLIEAPLDLETPEAADLFSKDSPSDPVERLDQVDAALNRMIARNEAPLRMMLAKSLERSVEDAPDAGIPPRQNRRTRLIEAALEPARGTFTRETHDLLSSSLALIIGTEAMVVLKDVLQLGDAEAEKVRRWAIRALVNAART
tara:strand:+ start:665 stop:1270 length:606 start_codon:yes stop_codon:yes gene_type:complete